MSNQVMAPENIKESVRDYYSEKARTVSNSCCGPTSSSNGSCCGPTSNANGCCSPVDGSELHTIYSTSEIGSIPEDAANVSLGCGNPTTIASLQQGEVVVDLGSGGGIDVFLASKQVGGEGFVYGIDMTDEMLELARRNAEKVGATNVEFRKGNIEDIPLAEKTADVVMSNCVINLSPDKEQTLAEAFRVLKPGGRVAISDIVVDGSLADLPVSESQIRTALNWAGCIAGALTTEQYRTLLGEAGFEDIDISIRHRYTLDALGQDIDELQGTFEGEMSPNVIHDLVNRFTSSSISARRP